MTEEKEIVRKAIVNKKGKVQYLPEKVANSIVNAAKQGKANRGLADVQNTKWDIEGWRELTADELRQWNEAGMPPGIHIPTPDDFANQLSKMTAKDEEIAALKKQLEEMDLQKKKTSNPPPAGDSTMKGETK